MRMDPTWETTMHCRLDHGCQFWVWVLGVFVAVASSTTFNVGMLKTRPVVEGICMLRPQRRLDHGVFPTTNLFPDFVSIYIQIILLYSSSACRSYCNKIVDLGADQHKPQDWHGSCLKVGPNPTAKAVICTIGAAPLRPGIRKRAHWKNLHTSWLP